MSVYIIAEAGSCHDKDWRLAHALICEARDVGADAVKFQFWSDANRLADRRRVPEHYRAIYQRYQLTLGWLEGLADVARHAGIDFMCTAYLPEDVAVVAPLVRHFKIASFEAGAEDLVMAHVPFVDKDITEKRDRMVLISMGMGANPEKVNEWICHGTRARHVKFLGCVSAYPAPVQALHLRKLWPCRQWFELDGFSDHTSPDLTWTGALAAAAGADTLEAHLRLVETDDHNPDAPHAMTPEQFAAYVRHVRFAETCLGTGAEGVHASERPMAQYRATGDAT